MVLVTSAADITLDDRITDDAGVLSPDELTEIEDAYAELTDETGQVIYVYFTEDFGGASGSSFAADLAESANLGTNNPLLAVAVEERSWGVNADDAGAFSSGDLTSMAESDVVPHLSGEDWAEAALAFGEGVEDLATPTTFGDVLGSLLTIALPLLGVALLVWGGVWLWRRIKAKREDRAVKARELAKLPSDHPLRLPLEELGTRTGSALVEIDEVLRASEQELQFATAEFGLQKTDPFREALREAKNVEREAFRIKSRIDDGYYTDEDSLREAHHQVLKKADKVAETITAKQKKFQKLRDLRAKAPQKLDELETRADELEAQLDSARARITALSRQFSQEALTSVREIPEEIAQTLTAARESVAEGRQRLERKDPQTALTHVQIAEEAVADAVTLLGDVDKASELLEDSFAKLDAEITSLQEDLAATEKYDDDAVIPAREATQQALAAAQEAKERRGDPIAALAQLEDAESDLDAALKTHREQEENQRRSRGLVERRIDRVESRVSMVQDYITTSGDVIGENARNMIAQASEMLEQAKATQDSEQAEQMLRDAERLANTARSNAEINYRNAQPASSGSSGSTARARAARRSRTTAAASSSSSSSGDSGARVAGGGCLGGVIGGVWGAAELGAGGLVLGGAVGLVIGALNGVFGGNGSGGYYSTGGSSRGGGSFGGGRSFGGGGGSRGGGGGGFGGGSRGGGGGRF
ncbi:TPM domain-containing protein [Nesterenkonia ebinurensis]|uniref:TPM domain-containing protein n=1 Tax=Nesterenkonia ebinurensis TaxID=2608252 RepID=UPI00123D5191|nr:TPM domain-containing protein [Nesterenkonia ebinurensis]